MARRSSLLAEQYLARGAKVLARLRGALVLAGLEADDGLAGAQGLLAEVAPVLLGRTRAQTGTAPLGVFVALWAKRTSDTSRIPTKPHNYSVFP